MEEEKTTKAHRDTHSKTEKAKIESKQMSDYLRSFLASEVVKEEVFERHEHFCPLQKYKDVFRNGKFPSQMKRLCICVFVPYERIVIERPVGLVVEAKANNEKM